MDFAACTRVALTAFFPNSGWNAPRGSGALGWFVAGEFGSLGHVGAGDGSDRFFQTAAGGLAVVRP